MYAGRVVERGLADEILDDPLHPYARGLIACIPALGKQDEEEEGDRPPPLAEIPGVVPPLHLLGAGCAFKDRCPKRFERCDREAPALTAAAGHPAACHAVEEGRI